MRIHRRLFELMAAAHIGGRLNAILPAALLQFALPVLGTGQAVHIMVGEQQVQNRFARRDNALRVRLNLHPRLDRRIACRHQLVHARNLHHTEPAGADLIDSLQIAERRNLHARSAGGL